MSHGHLETYGGSSLPTSPNWYWNPSYRDHYTEHSSAPTPPSSDDGQYTHTLLFAFRAHPLTGNTQLLLALKLRGFGAGTFNGIGGKIESGESALSSVIRETHEEVGAQLTAEDVRFVGRIGINVPGEGGEVVRIAVYTTHSDRVGSREVLRSEEVEARWYDVDASEEVGWEGLPEKLRPEHWVYLGMLVGTHMHRSGESEETLFDASVDFDPQPPKASLPPGERAENHRTVHTWSLTIFSPTPQPDHSFHLAIIHRRHNTAAHPPTPAAPRPHISPTADPPYPTPSAVPTSPRSYRPRTTYSSPRPPQPRTTTTSRPTSAPPPPAGDTCG